MPLWSGKVTAIHGGGACISRSCFPSPASSYRRRRVGLGLALQLGVQSTQTWSTGTTFHLSCGRSSNWRTMAEEQEQIEQDGVAGAISNAETELLEANGAPSDVATGSIFGAVALITGTSVGAGILALPAITAPIGFIPSATIMTLSWAFLVLEGLLLAEVNVELMRRREQGGKELQHSQVLSLRTMADETMGPVGALFTTVIYLMLSYTLMVAYISKSGEVLSLLLDVPHRAADVAFTFGLGGLLCAGGAKMADSVNQVLTVMLLGLFLLIVLGGATMADWTALEHVDWTLAPQTLPIIFLALVYHDLTPGKTSNWCPGIPHGNTKARLLLNESAINRFLEELTVQLGGDIGRIRISIILGSFVPLVMFLSWDAVALCVTPLLEAKDPIDVFMRVGGPGPAFIVESFAFLAVATSFIGTVLGLQEFLLEQWGEAQGMMTLKRLPNHRQAPRPLFEWWSSNGPRAITSLLVLAPPLVASSLVSDAFFPASDLAGAYGMTSLYGVIPPIMAWGLQNSSLSNPEAKTVKKNSQIMFDRITLATVGACAMAVIVGQVMIDLPQFSSSSPVVVAKAEQENLTPTSSVITQPFTTFAAP